MEHLLLFGSTQYLPFARNRIRAVRAAGQRYFGGRWDMPDGEVVTVRIEGDHEYIEIRGGTLTLAMDSGIVDLKGVEAAAPARYIPATRGETTSTQAYIAGYVPGTKEWAHWLDKSTAGQQLIGKVSFPPFAGHIRPAAEAQSFEPKRVAVTPATTPATWTYAPSDDALAGKKFTASKIPASIFTGRTRLYVQAIYGRPLYDYNSDAAASDSAAARTIAALASLSPPSLAIPAFKRSDDTVNYDPVIITTSTGLYFDPVTGKHWLMQIGGAGLTVYPMKATGAAEKARKSLVGGTLSADDKTKLESYVLAYSLPDAKNAFNVSFGVFSGPSYSMGYSWHWNFSGTKADIVTATTFNQDPVGLQPRAAMESTHRRIAISIDTDGTWTATVSVVEGPTRWAVHRAYWCITEPQWGGMTTLKSTPQNSTVFACDAPIYCFYNGDTLQTVRVNVSLSPATPRVRTMTPGFATNTNYGTFIDEFTAGVIGGFCEDAESVGAYYAATFTCGGVTLDQLNLPWTGSAARIDIINTGFQPGVLGFDNTYYGTHDFTYGYPLGWGPIGRPGDPVPHYEIVTIPNCLIEGDSPPIIRYTRRAYSLTRTGSSTATIIVPFYDSEAVFMEGTRYVETVNTGITSSTHASDTLASQTTQWQLDFFDPVTGAQYSPAGSYVKYLVSGTTAALTTSNPPDETIDTTTPVGAKLVCKAGAVQATMADLGSYHDNSLDVATVNYSAWSGAATVSPVAFSPTRISPVGVPGAIPQYPVLVGWV